MFWIEYLFSLPIVIQLYFLYTACNDLPLPAIVPSAVNRKVMIISLIIKLRTFFHRVHLLNWLVFGLILLYIIPIWAFKYTPTEDGPSHLNNAQILDQYNNPAYNFQKIYDLRLTPFPNWLYHAGLAALMWVFPPLASEKILLSLYVIGFPLAFIYFLGAVDPSKKSLGLISFVFIYSYSFMMGFFSFVFSIPLAFLALGYFWKHRSRLNFGQVIVLNLLLFMVYFGHLIPYLVTVGSIAFIAGIHFLGQWFALRGKSIHRRITSLGISLISLVPSLSLLAYYYLGASFSGGIPIIHIQRIPSLLVQFASMQVLVSYGSFGQVAVSRLEAVLFAVLFVITCIKRISRISFSQRRSFKFEDCFLFLFAILFALYLLMPDTFGNGGYLSTRLALLGCLFLLACFDISLPILPDAHKPSSVAEARTVSLEPMQIRRDPSRLTDLLRETTEAIPRNGFNPPYRSVMTVLFCLASLMMLAGVTYSFARLEPILIEYTAGIKLIKPNTVLLPMTFPADGNVFTIPNPIDHANHYYTLSNGVINLGNYEPFMDYFPIKYKTNPNLPIYLPNGVSLVEAIEYHQHILHLCTYTSTVNYLLVWGTPNSFFKVDIKRCYRLIYTNGDQKIYIPKQ